MSIASLGVRARGAPIALLETEKGWQAIERGSGMRGSDGQMTLGRAARSLFCARPILEAAPTSPAATKEPRRRPAAPGTPGAAAQSYPQPRRPQIYIACRPEGADTHD